MTFRLFSSTIINEMCLQYVFCVVLLTLHLSHFGCTQGIPEKIPDEKCEPTVLAEGEKKMSEQILDILDHFKKPDPVGLPGANIPDPYPVPDMKQSLTLGSTMHFTNTSVYGINKFKIDFIKINVAEMEVSATMTIKTLQAFGNYTLSTWLNRARGPFTVVVTGISLAARANIGVERDGKLRAQDINIDISSTTINMDFKNLGFFGNMFQGVINSVGSFLFDSIKPYIIKEAYTKARKAINEELDKVTGDIQFPNSVLPLDSVISEARKKVRDMGLDPYKLKDCNHTVGMFSVGLYHTWVTGLASFHRVGNITLTMENNTVIADFDIGTQKLEGFTHWEIAAVNGLVSKAGTASFSVDYISARIILAQSLDTKQRPQLTYLDLEIGNIQVRCDGLGTFDYVIELAFNVVPNLIRYQILDALEGPIKERIQQEFDKIDMEEILKRELPKLDNIEESEFKLSSLLGRRKPEPEKNDDDDDFFNF